MGAAGGAARALFWATADANLPRRLRRRALHAFRCAAATRAAHATYLYASSQHRLCTGAIIKPPCVWASRWSAMANLRRGALLPLACAIPERRMQRLSHFGGCVCGGLWDVARDRRRLTASFVCFRRSVPYDVITNDGGVKRRRAYAAFAMRRAAQYQRTLQYLPICLQKRINRKDAASCAPGWRWRRR